MIRAILFHALALASAYGDSYLTRTIVTHGGHEMNPAMRLLVSDRRVWYAAKLGGTAAVVYRAERARERGERNWWRSELVLATAQGFGAAWDLRQVVVHDGGIQRKVWFP